MLQDELGCAAFGARHHRQTAGHRFQRRVGARVVECGQDEGVGRAVERPRVFLRAEQRDALSDAELLRQPPVPAPGLVAPDDE